MVLSSMYHLQISVKVTCKCRSPHWIILHSLVVLPLAKLPGERVKEGQNIALMQADGTIKRQKVKELYVFEGMGKRKVTEVIAGDLCAVVGLEDFNIGDTIADLENPEALPVISVDEPTMSMMFSINNSPFFGKDGKFVTSRHLRDRLMKETEKNLAHEG